MEAVLEAPVTESNRPALQRFIAKNGGTEKSYEQWATQVGQRMHINKLDALVCAKLDVYTVAHLAFKATPLPEGIPLNEADNFLIDNSENPYELSKLYVAAGVNAGSFVSKESILNEFLTQFPKGDFERFGDPNNLASVTRSWFKKDGVALDAKIEEINSMDLICEEITIQDAIEFVMKYRPGTYKNPYELIRERVAERFKTITSFQVKDYYLEHIIKMCEFTMCDADMDAPF